VAVVINIGMDTHTLAFILGEEGPLGGDGGDLLSYIPFDGG
jgi:hypothetical protein